ncbi:hypothetical protein H072_10594 [Dactylellina haptotyla CBS 200.50]|uniref:Uncharacterized protein n=1 Tax=Dactylellina haptotyla (strain CBS 200.50) TaxID=1284197 RepID=S8BL47_DACHA|nr:hypothetical protein H072_10594 [Dactylellina haptotyla CBS 200.50]
MQKYSALAILSVLRFAASQTAEEDRVYPVNATGEWSFAAPQYSSRDNPANWTARVALTQDNYFQGDYYRTATWLDTPFDVPVNGSSIVRDVCLFMQLPILKRTTIDYSKGENGCNDVLGEECVAKLREFLTKEYHRRTADNGTMDCTSTQGVGPWHQSIYEICPVYKNEGGSGFQLNTLIPSDHETGSALHGDENAYWIAIGTPRNETEATAEQQYDEVSEYVFTYSIISGPTYDGMVSTISVDMVCVKAEDPVAGSRDLPSGASTLRAFTSLFSLAIVSIFFTMIFL